MNGNGDTLWTRKYVGTSYANFSVEQTTDGGFILCGLQDGDFSGWSSVAKLIKVDPNGNVSWTQGYGNGAVFDGYEKGGDVKQTADGGYIISGTTDTYSASPSSADFYVVKTNSGASLQWTRTYNAPSFGDIYAYNIIQTDDDADGQKDDGYLVSGYDGAMSLCVIKLSSTGTVQWYKTYTGIGLGFWDGSAQTSDGGFLVTGSNGAQMKLDASGVVQWAYNYQGSGITPVYPTSDGGSVIANGNGDVYLVKTDNFGHSGCNEYGVNVTVNNFTASVTVGSGGTQKTGSTTTVSASGFIVINLSTIASPLCEQVLLSLSGVQLNGELSGNNTVSLEWGLSNQEEYESFLIERSADGNVFEEIGMEEHQSGTKNYYFSDKTPYPGKSYYRIKCFRQDGNMVFSNQIEIERPELATALLANIYPNPSKDGRIKMDINLLEEGQLMLDIYNPLGQKITRLNTFKPAGGHTFTFDLSLFREGQYVYDLALETENQEYRLNGILFYTK